MLDSAPALVYLCVLLLCWADAFLPIVPSETTVLAAGALTGRGHLDLVTLVAAAAVGAVAGDLTAAALGRFLPHRDRDDPAPRNRLRRLASLIEGRVLSRVERHPYLMLLVARFIPGGRTAVTVGLGRSARPLSRLLLPLAVAGTLWALFTSLAGRAGAALVFERPAVAGLCAVGALAVVAAVTALRNRRRAPATVAASSARSQRAGDRLKVSYVGAAAAAEDREVRVEAA